MESTLIEPAEAYWTENLAGPKPTFTELVVKGPESCRTDRAFVKKMLAPPPAYAPKMPGWTFCPPTA